MSKSNVQHPTSTVQKMNYFQFFKLPIATKIDEAALRRAYLENSKKYHPDFHTLADDDAQNDALEKSTLNNEAWKTLSDPDRRLEYILKLTRKLAPEGQNQLPQDFLMEMMDINENLMELEFDFDKNRFSKVKTDIQLFENQLFETVKPAFENWSETNGTDAQLEVLKDFFLKKKYLLRVKENLSKFAPAFEQD